MLHCLRYRLKKKWMQEQPYCFLETTNKAATTIPSSAIHSGNGEYVVFTITGEEVGTAVLSVVGDSTMEVTGTVVITG
jgi:hypothetical protein